MNPRDGDMCRSCHKVHGTSLRLRHAVCFNNPSIAKVVYTAEMAVRFTFKSKFRRAFKSIQDSLDIVWGRVEDDIGEEDFPGSGTFGQSTVALRKR